MIIRDFFRTREDGVKLYKTYSDEGFYILQLQTQYKYTEAIDVEGSKNVYIETDEKIKKEEEKEVENNE